MQNHSGDKKLLIFLLRHGQPAFPDARPYLYGHTDYPLSETGKQEAEKLGRALAGVEMQRVVSSDLRRALETAEIACRFQRDAPNIEIDPRLREIHMGEWDGIPKEEVAEKFSELFARRGNDITSVCAPGGESFEELQIRAISALENIAETSAGLERVLLVAHGGLFWTIVSGLFDIPLSHMTRFGLDYCALHLLERSSARGWRLIRYNWSPDLADYMDYPIPV